MSTANIHSILRASLVPLPLQPARVAPVLRRIDGIAAVIFDFYDTLILCERRALPAGMDCSVVLTTSLVQTLRREGAVVPGSAAALDTMLDQAVRREHTRRHTEDAELVRPEVDMRLLWRELLAAPQLPQDLLDEAIARWEAWSTRSRSAPGTEAMLRQVRGVGLLTGIGSNAQAISEALFAVHFGGTPESLGFSMGVWSWRLGIAKPDPRFFAVLLAEAARLGLRAEQLLFVGNDPARDIAPASFAGMRTCLYAGDTRCLRPASGPAPDAVVTAFDQLGEVLGI